MIGNGSILPRSHRHGFTLLECLMACGILVIAVMAVISAVSAGQQQAYEAQIRVGASMAADDLLGRILVSDPATLSGWHRFREEPGTMRTAAGVPFPEHFGRIGRDVAVTGATLTLEEPDVAVQGSQLTVRVFDHAGRDLIVIERFLPGAEAGR